MSLLPLDEQVIALAQTLSTTTLRTLDALHLATALSVPDLAVLVTYDDRMRHAAQAAGLSVIVPR